MDNHKTDKIKIHFNVPAKVGNEMRYIEEVITNKKLSGEGPFNKKCAEFLKRRLNAKKVLMTPSCTHALEMAAILLRLKEGDEVIMPSYTFSSTATSVCIRGARPVFIDIREDTLNMDEALIEKAITPRTKAIFVMHYAGVGCRMDLIMEIARKYNLFVVEDAAQAIDAKIGGRYLGGIGHLGCFSFHETKNCVCGEGGALVINDERVLERAEIIREKGTNREKFFRGEVDKYTWVDIGSSYLLSELCAAYLYAQFENIDKITLRRKEVYTRYNVSLKALEDNGRFRLPILPEDCDTNYHIFFLLLPDEKTRNDLMDYLKSNGILAVFHYLPLHLSLMGTGMGYKKGDLSITEDLSSRVLRLPLYHDLTLEDQEYVISRIKEFFNENKG